MKRNRGKLVFAACVVLFVGRIDAFAESSAGRPAVRLIGPPLYDEKLDAMFSSGFTVDGSAWSEIRSRDLRVEKWVTPSGHTTLVLSYLDDRVVFTVTDSGFAVTRGDRLASYRPVEGNDEENQGRQDAVRLILIGSTSVRAFRAFTAAVERQSDTDNALTISALIDGAIVAALDGDVGAMDRVGNRLVRNMQGLRQVTAAAGAQFTDCLTLYYMSMSHAWQQYMGCYNPSSFWSTLIWGPICAWEYMFRAEGYWFQLLSCWAVPF